VNNVLILAGCVRRGQRNNLALDFCACRWPRRFESAHKPVLRIVDFTDELEAAFCQDALRCIRSGQGVGTDEIDVVDAQCISDERSSGFCRVTFALVVGSDAIGNFNHALCIRWALEATLPNRDARVQVHNGKAMHPGIRPG